MDFFQLQQKLLPDVLVRTVLLSKNHVFALILVKTHLTFKMLDFLSDLHRILRYYAIDLHGSIDRMTFTMQNHASKSIKCHTIHPPDLLKSV